MESGHFLGAAIVRGVKSEEWAELVRRGFDALQQGELDLFDEMSTPDLVLIQPP